MKCDLKNVDGNPGDYRPFLGSFQIPFTLQKWMASTKVAMYIFDTFTLIMMICSHFLLGTFVLACFSFKSSVTWHPVCST